MKNRIKIICLILSILSNIQFAEAQTQNSEPQTLEQLKIAIEQIRKNTNTPAVGIALVNRDGPYWIAGLGEANQEEHVKADENTMFRIGSISKMFVALSVMKLVEEGKLNLFSHLHTLAPEIKFTNKWEKTNPVLLVHLLEHTTGWDDLHLAEIGFKATDSSKLIDALNFHPDSRTSRWVPGTRFAYSNTGPAVAAYIIEKVTGMTFESYVQENFFNPLKMSDSTFFKSDSYTKRGARLYVNNARIDYSYPIYRPSATMNSSAKEMANLVHFFIQRGKFNETQLLSEKSISRMQTPKTTLGAEAGVTAGYGLHNQSFGFGEYGLAFYGHDGGIPGSQASLKYIPELQTGYIILTNTNGPGIWKIADVINQFLLKNIKNSASQPMAISSQLNAIAGTYVKVNPSHEILRFFSDINDAINISTQDNRIHRSPFMGGWESNDYPIAKNLAANPWNGLPSIAVVTDPLLGEVIQVEENTYKKTFALIIYGKIALIVCLVVGIFCNFVYAIMWIPRWLLGSVRGAVQIRLWPLLSCVSVCIALVPAMLTNHILKLGTLSSTSLALYIGSLLYPIFTGFSLISVYKHRNEPINKLVYTNTVIITALNTLFVCYLAYYGILGYRSWVD